MKTNRPPGRSLILTTSVFSALISLPLSAQPTGTDELRRLQEENASLRKRVSDAEAQAPTPLPSTSELQQPAVAAPAKQTAFGMEFDEDVLMLSPFEISSKKDYGYLKTNAVTATRIGAEIQDVPLNISVVSEDFIRDTGMRDMTDVLRYSATSAGDERMGIIQPATGTTPSGNLALRGFPINSKLRNGIIRQNGFNLDNVDRVEIIKGPAAVFFGQGYPGGVINYVTKRPQFSDTPSTAISYSYGGNGDNTGTQRATLDHNIKLNEKTAFRVVGAWDNRKGDVDYEFNKGYSVTPSLSFVPFGNKKYKINLEVEHLDKSRNQDDSVWIWSDQYFRDYQTPRPELIAISGVANEAAYRTRIFSSYANWLSDVRRSAGDNYIPGVTSMQRGAYYTDRAGNRVYDEDFNYYGRGSYSKDVVTTGQVTVEGSPFEWLDFRYAFTLDNSSYFENKSSAVPNADGMTFNTLVGLFTREYIQDSKDHQIDLVFKASVAGNVQKILVGGVLRETEQSFIANNGVINLTGTGQYPFFGNIPGALSKPDEGYTSPVPVSMVGQFVTATQVVRNRAGQIITPVQIFTQYDPGVHVNPDLRRITEVDRGLIDHTTPKREDMYVNYQGSWLEERLTIFGGWRHEKLLPNGGQMQDANPPWYTGFPDMIYNLDPSQYSANAVSPALAYDYFRWYDSDSYMGGLSFAITKSINIYASWSQTGVINTGTKGNNFNSDTIRTRAIAIGLNPDAEVARIVAEGANDQFKTEKGTNYEVGAKVDLWNQKVVGTFSVFRAERSNRKLDDFTRQTNDPINYTGANKTGTYNRILRWYSNDAEQQTEGAEAEFIWTPIRNYQAVINGSWMWTAKTVKDPSILPSNVLYPIIFNDRLPGAPEFRFNIFNKYTFKGNLVKDLSVGLGARYASEIIIGNTQDYNPDKGGLTAGDYLTFDGNISYPWKLFGTKVTSSLSITNILDEDYSEGGANLAQARTWSIATSFKF